MDGLSAESVMEWQVNAAERSTQAIADKEYTTLGRLFERLLFKNPFNSSLIWWLTIKKNLSRNIAPNSSYHITYLLLSDYLFLTNLLNVTPMFLSFDICQRL